MADLNTNIEETQQEQQEQEDQEQKTPTVEELLAQIAQKDAAYAKLKNANDKTSSEIAKLKKQITSMQTADQQAAAAKAEAEEEHKEYVANLEKFQKQTMAKDRYLAQGMDVNTAARAAEAEIGGDMDALSAINKSFMEAQIKARETEWRKSIPDPKVGVGDNGEEDPFLKGFNSVGNYYTQK